MAASLSPGPATPGAPAGCYHCGEALPADPARVTLDGAPRAFCCSGCATAAQWIRDARLDDYYRLRNRPATRVGTEPIDLALWDREELLAGHARELAPVDGVAGREITVLSDGMRCAACAWLIDRVLAREPGVLEASANAVTGRIRIAWDPAATPLSRPLGKLAALGYRPYLATGEARERARRSERNRALLRIGLAGLGAMQAMMFAEALYLDTRGEMPLPTRDFFRWITFLVSTPVVFWAGWPFIAGAWRELRERVLGMDTLVAGATLLAYVASVWGTVTGAEHVWYDAAVMFVFLLLVARQLEQRARGIASAQVDALARARPAFASRERADGSRESVPIATLQVGDVACVAVGESVPADGVLLDPHARFEEALLTGESSAVDKRAGDPVYAGTACREHPARLRVTGTGSHTRLAQLAQLVEQAQAHRPALAASAERIASGFVAALLLIAALVYAGWRVHDPARALEVTLALLVISCPCALSLAVPAALAAAHGALARLGVLAVRPDALERLARASDVVLDKTGTLSDGQPTLTAIEAGDGCEPGQALRIAAALERDSGHPLAAAFAQVTDVPPALQVRAVPGQGVEGTVAGRRWRLGQAGFAAAGTPDDGALWLGDGTRAHARFLIGEAERLDARAAVAALHGQGLVLHLSSGDGEAAVQGFARALDIDTAHARQSPEDKLAYVRRLQRDGRIVAMVGDGLNDAPVLAGADVSLAVGEGAALAQRAADFVLTGRSLARLPAAIEVARRTRRIIRQNLAWALGYNLLALPLAAAGLVTPWLAALGMALSSLAVTANALRLTRVRNVDGPAP
ncbi:heavy metal translocating P-type ATPase [Cognatiluteimonas weifangensis]|uniref:Cadmium-translocating P-type ATPase n=1 Tax=Cognatiluteimonas weifangensis TaxID=2303539 RepID=A0A372DNU1_9GAMM|nr:heavy metal translocating P-type ATPase [Luteimonas weifangensis]RFP61144.1 cadmium-translocating P-type ATPase [Luteimonas weifangensis]